MEDASLQQGQARSSQPTGWCLVSEEQLRKLVREEVSMVEHTCTQGPQLREILQIQQKQQGMLDQIMILATKHDETLYGPGKPDQPGLVQHVGKLLESGGSTQWLVRAVLGAVIPVLIAIISYTVLMHGADLVP